MRARLMPTLLLFPLLLITCGPSQTPWKEPRGVGVTSWGMTMAAFRTGGAKVDCQESKSICTSDEWLGDDVQTRAYWHFVDGKLHAVTFVFPAIQFFVVQRYAIAVYGPMHQQTFPVYTTHRGGEWLNETGRWQGPHVQITLEHYGQISPLGDKGQLRFTLTPQGFAQYIGKIPQAQAGEKPQEAQAGEKPQAKRVRR